MTGNKTGMQIAMAALLLAALGLCGYVAYAAHILIGVAALAATAAGFAGAWLLQRAPKLMVLEHMRALARAIEGKGAMPRLKGLPELEQPAGLLHAHLQKLEERVDTLQTALEAVPIPLVVCDEHGAVQVSSRSAMGLHGGAVTHMTDLLPQDVARELLDKRRCEAREITRRIGGEEREAALYALPAGLGVALQIVLDAGVGKKAWQEREQGFLSAARRVNDLAQQLASASELMSSSADEQAKGANRQKEQTNAAARSIEQMSQSVLEVASNAATSSDAAREAREAADQGADLVRKVVHDIDAVAQSASELSGVLSNLDAQSGEIGRIIGVINDIADQTNLLALNAAIEAARAGDAGRGFAVVADEVRKLAEKTMTATKEVENSIRTIQNFSKNAVDSMERTARHVTQSTELVNQAGHALESIMRHIGGMVDNVEHIASSTEQQSTAAEEVSQLIEEIADIAKDADEGASQQAYATRELASLSQELLTLSQHLSGHGDAAPGAPVAQNAMKGVLPKLMQEYVQQKYGDKVYKAMQTAMGNPVFLASSSYPDDVIGKMAEHVARAAGANKRKVLYDLGFYTPGAFHRIYPAYFKNMHSYKAFVLAMNDVHHRVTKDMPGARPPKFTYEDKGDVLFVNYRSQRRLFDYFEGVLQGAAAYFKEKADITMKPLGDDTARAEIRFRNKR